MRKRKSIRRAALALDLPEDVLVRGARITLIAQGCVLVEGQRGVVELSDDCIRMRTDCGVAAVSGRGLRLEELSPDAAVITGDLIDTVTYNRPQRTPQSAPEG